MVVTEVIKEMINLHNAKEFLPQQEADIQCLMYHLIIQQGVRLSCVHASYPIQFKESWIHPDIIIGNPNNIGECEIIEIKFMQKDWDLQPGRITRRMETSEKDLKKLSGIECKSSFFIFFNEARPLSEKRKRRLSDIAEKGIGLIFLEMRNGKLVKVPLH